MEIHQPFSLDEGDYVASVSNLDGTLTISPTTGDVIASLNLSNANTWLAPQYFYDSLSNLTLDTDLKQLWSSTVLMFDWSANTFKPNEDIAFPNEFDVFQFGSDPSTTKSGLPLRFRWEGTGGGSGWLKFDDGAGNLQILRSNIEADSIAVSSIAGSSASFGSLSGTTITSSSISNKQVVFSNSGVLTGDVGYEYDSTNNRLLISNASITAQNQLHLHQSGATALGIQLTNSATGSASGNGSLISVTSAGVLEINQRANQVMNFYTNNTVGMTINTSQQVLITGGTVSAPSLAIGGDTDTGMYRWNATANHLGFAAGGAVGLIVGHSNGTPYVSVSSDATRIGNLVKFNVGGTGNGGDSPIIGIKNSSETTTGKNGGIFTQTRMTSRYLQTSQNIGFNDNSFGNPGVIQWTAWEYPDNTYTTLVTPTEFTGWSYQYYNGSAYKNLLRIHTSGIYINGLNAAAVPAARLHVNSTTASAGTPGTEDAFVIGRALNSNVSYQQVATFAIGTYSTNSIANGYGPDTRLDLKLKASSSDNFTSNVTVMTWLDTGSVGIGETSPTARLQIKSSTSGTGSNAFRIQSAGSADRLVYRDDGRLWLGTGTASYNALLNLDSSGTQTEIQFTTNATGRTSTDGAYLMYSDSIGFRYLNMEAKPHVFYIGGSEVARFSETGAVMQITGTLAAQYSGAGSSRGGAISLVSSAGTAQDWIIATAGNDNSVVDGRSWFLYDNTSGVARFFVDKSSRVGVGLGATEATAFVDIVASTSTIAQIRMRAGEVVSAPNDGELWYENTNDRLMFRKNTTTSEVVSASAVTTEVVVSNTTLTITYNGVTYKLLAVI